MVDPVVRQALGIESGPLKWVLCYGHAGGGCGKCLAEILYDREGTIELVVRAPYHVADGVVVLERAGKASDPATVVPVVDGERPAFRCPRCHKVTSVNLVNLVNLRSAWLVARAREAASAEA